MDFAQLTHYVEVTLYAFLALTAVLNPIGNVPVFIELTQGLDEKTKRQLYNITVITAFLTLFVLTFTGRWIMEYVFQIRLEEFRIAGGVLLIIIAVNQIVFTHHHKRDPEHPENILELGVVPMAIPLLVGPGSIVTSLLILDRDGPIIAIVSLVTVFLFTWLIFRSSAFLNRFLGKYGSLVVARVLYIFIAAIGVHFLVSGIAIYFKISV